MSARVTCTCGWAGGPYASIARAQAMADKHKCDRPTRQVRKATRHHRCQRCGYQATYPDAGAVEARYWFDRHSCQKQENAMVRAAMAEMREALVDRTPKPCLHKFANHQHGQRATYVLDKCRCEPCSRANAEAETWRERQKAYGRYNKYVPAEFVREHLAELAAYGIGLKRVAKISGVSTGTLSKIWYGSASRTDRGPSVRVLRSTAERIYAVEPVPANLADGARISPAAVIGVTRRMQALVALGWSQSKLAARLGVRPSNFRLTRHQWSINAGTAVAAKALYEELSMQLPPEETHRDRIAASRARNYAAERGWVPPLALDDELLDEAEDEPVEVLAERTGLKSAS